MEKFIELNQFFQTGIGETALLTSLINFIGAMAVSFLVRAFYVKYSYSLTGKSHIGSVLPILTGIVFLVIIVVKSSLALSLGLVGALSIVRFRTPIKEPEELVYLFLAIAIGLGFAAGYSLITTCIVLSILIVIYIWLSNSTKDSYEYNIVLSWGEKDLTHQSIVEALTELASSLKLIRFESSDDINTAVFLIELKPKCNIDALVTKLRLLDKKISVNFFESKVSW